MKVIIFSKFARMVHIIHDELKLKLQKTKLFTVTGETENKQEIVDLFNTETSSAILISSDALNFGFNIETADVIINFDLPFTPSKKEQRAGRGDRLSRTTSLLIIDIIAKNTYEEKIVKILEKKQRYINEAVTGLSEKDLISELFK